MAGEGQGRGAAIAAALAYALIWAGAVGYLYATNGDWTTPVFVMAIFGLALSGMAWLLTRGANAPAIVVERPALESIAVLVFLGLYAVLFLGFGMSAAREALPPGPGQELLVMGLKLTAHILLPALLLVMLGARLAPLFQTALSGRKFWRTLIVLGAIILGLLCVISPSLQNIAAENPAPALLAWIAPASFVWITLEAGLCEEFLYRAVLQTRLSAWLRSPWTGVFATSILFGIAHAPGLFLRGGPGVDGWSTDPLQVVAHTIATLSPMGLLFGLIYARTKSLLLVVLLHGLVDVLPNMADFIRIWT
ncbi:MAG: lysostaphin resistance A-like protein [Hyphomonadaceae bacterium]